MFVFSDVIRFIGMKNTIKLCESQSTKTLILYYFLIV